MLRWFLVPLVASGVLAGPYNSSFNGITIHGPDNLTQCDLAQFTWEGGEPPYTIMLQTFPPGSAPLELGYRVESRSGFWNTTSLNLFANSLGGAFIGSQRPPQVVFGVIGKLSGASSAAASRRSMGYVGYDLYESQSTQCLMNHNAIPNDTLPLKTYTFDYGARPQPGNLTWYGNTTTSSVTQPTAVQTVVNNVNSGLSTAATAGIAVGVIIGVIGLLVGIFFLFCRRRYYNWKDTRDHKQRAEKTQQDGNFDMIEPYELAREHTDAPLGVPMRQLGEPGSSATSTYESSENRPLIPVPNAGARSKAREAAAERAAGSRGPGASSAPSSSGYRDDESEGDVAGEETGPESSRRVRLHEDGGRLTRVNDEDDAEDVPPVYNPQWSEQ